MVIEHYAFGRMTVNGRVFTSDLMILPNREVHDEWWRRRGHVVGTADLGPILTSRPELLILGTGASGMMRPEPSFEAEIGDLGIRLIAAPTADAAARFNAVSADLRCAAAFHLTC
jgi:hypothetical protein